MNFGPGSQGNPAQAHGLVQVLRGVVQSIERKYANVGDVVPLLPFDIASIDAVLGGGLAVAALHEIAAAGETEIAAATAFTVALAARQPPARAVLWIGEDMTVRENGILYGTGLDAFGLSPERIITVTVARAADVLWAMEEALRCRAVGVVIGEIRNARIDDVALRRLSLAATERGRLALLLRTIPAAQPIAAATRWVIDAAPSVPSRDSIGPPRIGVQLVRNRHGRLDSWVLEWNCVERRFQLVSAHPQPLAAAALDRPHQTAVA